MRRVQEASPFSRAMFEASRPVVESTPAPLLLLLLLNRRIRTLKNDFKAGLENGERQNDLPYLWEYICERSVARNSRYSE